MIAKNRAHLARGARALRVALITPTPTSVRLASTSAATTRSGASSSSNKGVMVAVAAGIGAGVFALSSLSRPALQLEDRRRWDQRLAPKTRPASKEAPKAVPSSDPEAQEGAETIAKVEAQAAEEEEEGEQSAYDPSTGEINWDCPCLGGMAHGPCGEQFKDAFSCFVYSEKEPKGIDCVEKFKMMQDCFRKYPEHYKEEIEDDEAAELAAAEAAETSAETDKGSA